VSNTVPEPKKQDRQGLCFHGVFLYYERKQISNKQILLEEICQGYTIERDMVLEGGCHKVLLRVNT
jgi:hypothetical protein